MIRIHPGDVVALWYADIFDYPLSRKEAKFWRIGTVPPRARIRDSVCEQEGFLFFRGRRDIVAIRRRRAHFSKEKMKRAASVARMLSIIPSVLYVGVSGSVSMNNAERKDDIDVFIVSSRGTLWATRMLTTLLLSVLGIRRTPHTKELTDKICLNMYMDEDDLALPKHDQNLFTAHEVLQLMPLVDKAHIHDRLLQANTWVGDFLPNAWKARKPSLTHGIEYGSVRHILSRMFAPLEKGSRYVQQWYMRRRKTTEVVGETVIRFHPKDAKTYVYDELKKRMHISGIPLDFIFYHL